MNSATKLTFDLLGYIFHHYAETETATHPLETLLLVSRSWSEAALGHRVLWSHFKVYITLDQENTLFKIWKARLPLRLQRCGDTIPLHIDLRLLTSLKDCVNWKDSHIANRPLNCSMYDSTHPYAPCACLQEAVQCIDDFVPLLAGEHGKLCQRWKSLHLEVPDRAKNVGLKYKRLGALLRYPMPILTSLLVINLNLMDEKGIFPHIPLLQHLTWLKSNGALPSLKSVRSLKIAPPSRYEYMHKVQIPGHIEELVLQGEFECPKCMPKLWNLDISGSIYSLPNDMVEFPNLTHLTLNGHNYRREETLLQIQYQSLSRVVSFGVYWDPSPWSLTFKGDVLQILRASKTISSIHGNPRGISVVLKLVSEEPEWEGSKQGRLLAERQLSLMVHPRSALLYGDESRDQLRNIARALKVYSPDASWDSIMSL